MATDAHDDNEAAARVVAMLDAIVQDLLDDGIDSQTVMTRERNARHFAEMIGSTPEYAENLLVRLGDISLQFAGDAEGGDGMDWAIYLALKLGERIGFARGMQTAGMEQI